MKPQTTGDLWRARDQLATCVRLATEAQRRGELTYESCFIMPRGWRNRGQQTVLLHGLRMVRIGRIVTAVGTVEAVESVYPRLQWLRGDVGKTLAIGPLRLLRFERSLRWEYRLDDAGWRQLLLDRETPCPRCQVRFYGGMDRWRMQTYQDNGLDSLEEESQDLLDHEADQEAYLLEHGFIRQADYAAFERSRR